MISRKSKNVSATCIRRVRSVVVLIAVLLFAPIITPTGAGESICYGSTARGYIQHAVRLSEEGRNFQSYSRLAVMLGRTWMHSVVHRIILDTYGDLENMMPDRIFVYGETGLEHGGRFAPHKTHQNGLSVDFMTPVIDQQGKSVPLPTSMFNRYGYDIEFSAKGIYKGLRIDYEAIARHLVALHRNVGKQGIHIRRVLFDPELQPDLFATRYGDYLKQHIMFARKRSWVRHDDHYHVDFKVACKPYSAYPRK